MIITLCGSVSHPDLIREAAREITLQGHAVFAPEPMLRPVAPEEASVLTRVHLAKIRRADAVVAIRKPDGTVGDAVASEVAYAEGLGKKVTYI